MNSWENKHFLLMPIHINNQTINNERYHLNNFLLNKWKSNHLIVPLIPDLHKIVIKIQWYLNLCNHKSQTCHQKLISESMKNLLLDKVKDNLHLIVPKNLYKNNQTNKDLLQDKRRDCVDMKIFRVEKRVYWINFLKNNSINQTIKTKSNNWECRNQVKVIEIQEPNPQENH